MLTHRNPKTYTNMDELLGDTYQFLNERNIGNGPSDPSIAILIQTTGTYTANEAEMKVTIFEGFKDDAEIAVELTTPGTIVQDNAPERKAFGQGAIKA